MKKMMISVLALVVLLLAGCAKSDTPTTPESTSAPSTSVENDTAALPPAWEAMNATFTREDSSQYNNATLMMKYLSNSCALFEFRLMEGSEAEDSAVDTILSGVLIIGEDGAGVYETIPDAENPFSVQFTLSEDGQTVDITHDGALTISPDGRYGFVDNQIEVSDTSVGEILGFLPTAATSLNSNLGTYTINYPDALISDWFYSVEAVFDDSGAVLAKFLIAKDLSAVFRVDDDIEPVMIYGTAQPMMDATIMEAVDASSTEGTENSGDAAPEDDPQYEPRPLVSVTLSGGAYLTPGATSQLAAVIPADLPYTLTAKTLDEAVAVVDESGKITAVGVGETQIQCTVACEDGTANINVFICVTDEPEYDTVLSE